MATARDTGKFFSTGVLGHLAGTVLSDLRHLTNQLPDLKDWLASPKDHHVPLLAQGDLAADGTVHTGYFEATRPMEIGPVKTNFGAVPGTFAALTAEIRVTRGGAAEASGMLSDTPVSVLTADATPITMSVETDSSLADANQLWYLAKGDKVRVKIVETGGSGTMQSAALQFTLVAREV